MNIDTAIDRFVFDVGVIDKFEYFIPALYDHLLILMQNSLTRGFGFEYYIDLVNIIQNESIEFVRRYEAKNDIIFNIKDDEIMDVVYTVSKNNFPDFINEKIKEFRMWRMQQELKDIVSTWSLKDNNFVSENFPEAAGFIEEICSEEN